jgi:DNA-binding response OmpR family regulator
VFGNVYSPRIRQPRSGRETFILPAKPALLATTSRGAILIVQPNFESERELCETLRGAGYEVEVIQEDKLERVSSDDVEIVLLFVSGSEVQTYGICSTIKHKRATLPIIVIGPDDASTKLRFFSLGANDYVLGSFDRLELLARIKSQIRRHRANL